MQGLFPEGLMFYESLYGIAWSEYLSDPINNNSEKEGKKELEKVTESIFSAEAKSTFQQNLSLPNGAFYYGWSTYFLGKKISITNSDSIQNESFKLRCEEIASNLGNSESPYLESYRNQFWPADMVICIAALALHDKLFEPKYERNISSWIVEVEKRLDKNGLIPHSVKSDGYPKENARGSSMSLMLSVLPEINTEFSKNQHNIYKELFCQERLGLTAIREYAINDPGKGDIDSGPVIWGIGTAATLVGQRAALQNGDYHLASELYRGINSFGFTIKWNNQRTFLGGSLPIADAFIAWSRTSLNYNKLSNGLYWKFHIISSIIVLVLLLFVYVVVKRLRLKNF